MQEPTEEQLVRATSAGDRSAYAILYDRYAPLVRAVCYDYSRNLADAQDLAQDVFLRAYQRLDQLRKPESFGPWIVSIAKRRCAEWRRQVFRDRNKRERSQELRQAGTGPERDGELPELGRLIAALPEKERLALNAFYLRGKSVEEARRIVELSRSGFYKVLKQALTRLRRSLLQESEGAR